MTDSSMLGESGLRTLASAHASYRPGGYHTGSAWPFDGVLTARGLEKHGFVQESMLVQARIKKAIESCGDTQSSFVVIGQIMISLIVLFRMYNLKMRAEYVRIQIELHNHLKSFKGGPLPLTPGLAIGPKSGIGKKMING